MYSSLCSLLHPIMEEKRGSVCYECNCCYSIAKSFPTLWPHGLQHPRLPYPSLSSRVFSDSCPLNQWCYLTISPATPFSLLLSPSIFPIISVFSNELAFHLRWPQYWSFSFSNSPFNEYSGLVSFKVYWFDLLAVQGTLKSLLQHHNLKASILWCSAFFILCFHSRRGVTHRVRLECDPDIPVAPGEQYYVLDPSLDDYLGTTPSHLFKNFHTVGCDPHSQRL